MRFTNVLAIFASATATSALPLSLLDGLFGSAPTANSLVQSLGAVNNELVKLNVSLAGLNTANLQSQATGTGSNVNNIVNNLLGPVLRGLTVNGGLQTAYNTALSQLGTLNNQGVILTPAQASQVATTLNAYQNQLTQVLALIQANQPAFTTASGSGLLGTVQNLLGGSLGGSAATPVSTVQSWLSSTLNNNGNLLTAVSTLLQRTQPTIQSTLQQVTNLLQGLIRAQVTVYGPY
ncbi:hypothetical protein GCG54_00007372 [Colletotrichum gloeosporioides]|uniref:Cell wall protein n=1 Tax=Colletotrichum gloeosporioides TaxID=474922 RepID=A0A8H4CNE8_COLGL|nr:uncharacterized protein GCG54_00007372 [Colletotrichum gloeosporioides]KAF3807115.1 hypothetical protein GCG54_00007372 [Colletotrichum gloeosporioides]